MPEDVIQQVEALRRKLLDLSLRNRMLNFRPSRRLGVTVAGEDAVQVHRLLVEEGRKLAFRGRPDPRPPAPPDELSLYDDPVSQEQFRQDAVDELNAMLEYPHAAVNVTDRWLETEEPETILQAKLRAIQREASLAREELGIDTLFLTLGMLEWREPQGERSFRAPLLFIPVELERQTNGSLRLAHTGGDPGENLPLGAKLLEFNLRLPRLDEDEGGLESFIESVRTTVRVHADWKVHPNEIALGFFNYEKYVMYVDLGGEAWPEGRKPWEHADVRAMLGTGYPPLGTRIDEETFLDDVRPVDDCHEVFDADGSQTLALLRAASGASIVVEGPPGTGKSQTITNIIAESVAAGKRVLFVAAKRAALEVVRRRLEEAGLGDIALDLHDKLASRRQFYAELKRTAERSLTVRDEQEAVERLAELRDRLNGYAADVNDPLPGRQCTPVTAMARLAQLPPEAAIDRDGRVDPARLRHLPEPLFRRRLPLVEALQARLRDVGVPAEHPFHAIGLDRLDPGLRLDLHQDLETAVAAWDAALSELAKVSEAMGIPPPTTMGTVSLLRTCAERIQSAPPLAGVAVHSRDWRSEEPLIREVAARMRHFRDARGRAWGMVREGAWNIDWTGALESYERWAPRWYRTVSGEYRRARALLARQSADRAPADPMGQLDLLRDLVQVARDRDFLFTTHGRMARLFGPAWQGEETTPEALERVLEWVLRVHAEIEDGRLPAALAESVADLPRIPDLAARVSVAEKAARAAVDAYRAVAEHLRVGDVVEPEPCYVVAARLRAWRDALDRLPAYLAYTAARAQALDHELDAVVEIADRWPGAEQGLLRAVVRSYYEGVVREAADQRPRLRTFEREQHEAAIREFRRLDDFKLRYNRARVRLAHRQRLPSFGQAAGNLLLLRQQCELQRRHKSIRWIMARAGEAVMAIKPVFMMSPLTAAIHLPPEAPPFDIVIFDEASQVRPEDALCSIVRGRQTIVVGDTRQMPPTSFFDRVAQDDDLDLADEQADAAAELGAEARKLESILSAMSAVAADRARRPDLRWHYRSLHPALIQPSNELFYDNRLIVFPSAEDAPELGRAGVVMHYLPDAVYEGGARRRINRAEAERVADAVVAHLRDRPDDSLLVAAMNRTQADLIYDLLLVRERAEPQLFAEFAKRHPHEPLDVKNLENVQGDERDVIFLSITYGRDSAGVLRQHFGPLLLEGGERRLNVLITRARRRCEVFTSMLADDIRLERPARGVEALKRYLEYARTGRLEIVRPTGDEPESPFEEEVRIALEERGYCVDSQVGSEGYRIDLAVRDREHPGRYLLGIECDGAAYHSARSARDRDKLRQRVLEERGWRLHRIWSADWWQDPQREIQRLCRILEEPHESETPPAGGAAPGVEITEAQGGADLPAAMPYPSPPPMSGPRDWEGLAAYGKQVVAVEGPIVHDLLLTRLREASGSARMGTQIRLYLEHLIAYLAKAGAIQSCGDAWISPDQALVEPRDRTCVPDGERKAELIPEVEIGAALRQVIGGAFGIRETEVIQSAFTLLGFRRVTARTRERGAGVLAALLRDGVVVRESGALVLPRDGAS